MTAYRQISTDLGVVTFDNDYYRSDGVIIDAVPDDLVVLEIHGSGCVISPLTFEKLRQYRVKVRFIKDDELFYRSLNGTTT